MEDLMADAVVAAGAQQHLRALEHANHVRFARAELKRQVRCGGLSAAEVILTCPWQVRTMSLSELLASQRHWGRVRSRRLLLSLRVGENKQVGTLTERQRLALAATLSRGRGSRGPPRGEPA
jgi:hypothetical protein